MKILIVIIFLFLTINLEARYVGNFDGKDKEYSISTGSISTFYCVCTGHLKCIEYNSRGCDYEYGPYKGYCNIGRLGGSPSCSGMVGDGCVF